MDTTNLKYLDNWLVHACMNGYWLLNPTAASVKNATVFYYIYATFLFSTCLSCVYVIALKLKSSHNATMAFVSYTY